MERVLQVVGTLAARERSDHCRAGRRAVGKKSRGPRRYVKAGQELALIDTTSYEAVAKASAANLARANASAANAAQNLKRIQDLQKDKIASTSDLDAAVAEAARTRAEVKAAEANDAIARLDLDRSRVSKRRSMASSPNASLRREIIFRVGAPIARLVQTDPLRLRLEVPERESVAVRAGQSVRVFIEGDTNIYRGQFARIAPAIRADNRMLLVEADVPNPGGLRAGLFARAQIISAERERNVSVPASAIITFAGLEKVVSIKDGKATEKTVTTGAAMAIGWKSSGLSTGETIVLDPAGIRTGQAVTIQSIAAGGGADERHALALCPDAKAR
jgi:HlyD family secretion protein